LNGIISPFFHVIFIPFLIYPFGVMVPFTKSTTPKGVASLTPCSPG